MTNAVEGDLRVIEIMDALIDTASRTTELESVYDDISGKHFPWEEVMTCRAELVKELNRKREHADSIRDCMVRARFLDPEYEVTPEAVEPEDYFIRQEGENGAYTITTNRWRT